MSSEGITKRDFYNILGHIDAVLRFHHERFANEYQATVERLSDIQGCQRDLERVSDLVGQLAAGVPADFDLAPRLPRFEGRRRALRGIDSEAVEDYYRSDRCSYCLRPTTDIALDHIKPWSKGGSGRADNLAPVCRSCNSRKGDRSLIEFVAAGGVS